MGWSAALNAHRQPRLYLVFDPADRSNADLYATRELLVGLELVDRRAAKTCDSADLRKAQYLQASFERVSWIVHVLHDELTYNERQRPFPLRRNILGAAQHARHGVRHDSSTRFANPRRPGNFIPVRVVLEARSRTVWRRHQRGHNPATNDWEFIELDVKADGVTFLGRGHGELNMRNGLNCLTCHQPAKEMWDLICDRTQDCLPIPLSTLAANGAPRAPEK
jgi:hypothetical protein